MTTLKPLIYAACALALVACGSSSNPDAATADGGSVIDSAEYTASIRRGSFGVPHITGSDYGDIGYGYGYVHAQDNLCVLAEDLITIKGERARHFGRDAPYTLQANGNTTNSVDSDFFWRHVATQDRLDAIAADSSAEAEAASAGFAAGYSRYVREIQQGLHPGRHQDCRDAAWVEEITLNDMYRRYFRLAVLASSSVFVGEIGTAQPPTAGGIAGTSSINRDEFPLANGLDIGSNMYALSSGATAGGESMLFGNPHFPWIGTERLYQAHMTIPGELDIMGSALYGIPAALIGFNEHFAWSHTVSTAYRFTFFELTLAPGDPTSYVVDGATVPMEATDITIEILEDDGSVTEQTRTLYKSEYGPMMTLQVEDQNVLRWDNTTAYSLRDANAENTRLINQFFEWNRANSLQEFIDLHASVLGVPWVNTIATGPGGQAYYGDVTVVPNVPDSKVTACPTQVGPAIGQLVPGLPVLDGSRSDCNWDTDDDAPAPGIFGPANLPKLERNDWVHNCNDSYWLTHPDEPITGFAAIIGNEEAERSLRTRLCIQHVLDRLGNLDDRGGNGFQDLDQLQDVVLSSEVYTARIALDDVLSSNTMCANPTGTLLGTEDANGDPAVMPVDITGACTVLDAWDRSNNLDSVGGHIWREFWRRADDATGGPWLTPFSAADPVNTPNDINTASPEVQAALANAVTALAGAGIALDAPMRDIQFSVVHNDEIPIFGGEGFEGSFTIAGRANLDGDRYPVIRGNSYIQTVTWDSNGDPVSEGFVTYSQSTDPASPWFQDMTQAYSDKAWIPWRFTEAQVQADPNLTAPLVISE
ncbi:hypothetical protein GYB61_04260 [bacterium]|nr:hypothetical protein [bacterium]